MIKFKKKYQNGSDEIREFKTKKEIYKYVGSFVSDKIDSYKIWVHENKSDDRFTNNWGTHTIVVGTVGVLGSTDGWFAD